MLQTIDELKSFIEWAKSQKLKAVKVGEIQFEFSDLALVVESNTVPSETLPDQAQLSPEEEEKLLYWSSRP